MTNKTYLWTLNTVCRISVHPIYMWLKYVNTDVIFFNFKFSPTQLQVREFFKNPVHATGMLQVQFIYLNMYSKQQIYILKNWYNYQKCKTLSLFSAIKQNYFFLVNLFKCKYYDFSFTMLVIQYSTKTLLSTQY